MDMPIQITDINTIITERYGLFRLARLKSRIYGLIPHALTHRQNYN